MAEPPIAQPITPPPPPSEPQQQQQQQQQDTTTTTPLPLHTPPPPFTPSTLTPLTQGAEALVYKTSFLTPNTPAILKYRPPKPYRHPVLDRRLTRQRLLAEARGLVRVRRDGVNVPRVLGADWDAGWIVMEFVEGRTVRRVLDEWVASGTSTGTGAGNGEGAGETRKGKQEEDEEEEEEEEEDILNLMRRVGAQIGKLHALGVCHGDLTTSNIMLRSPPSPSPSPSPSTTSPSTPSLQGAIYLIDFGLTSTSIADEDKAVDLYVLERAFSATHPAAEPLFQEVLRAYGVSGKDGGKAARRVLKRLEGVRLRGRKRNITITITITQE
ncbi:serine/threonine-protein kinase bud32 [Exserohilum turcicum]